MELESEMIILRSSVHGVGRNLTEGDADVDGTDKGRVIRDSYAFLPRKQVTVPISPDCPYFSQAIIRERSSSPWRDRQDTK